jgi:type II secretory pathway predicted ATPase ExeA/TolA-binding protein
MYRSYYNLVERPFEIAADTRFLWMGEKHKEALAMLKYGVLVRKGFLLLTGDVGTGKTTLVNALLESLDEDTLVANITDPLLEPVDFFNFIAASFRIDRTFNSKADFLIHFGRFLRQAATDGKNVLLILDEAHRLSKGLLEQFRLLSNIELPEKKLINIFFVGQDEFNRTLMSADCRALRQRITLTYNIKPLSEGETLAYIRHRLKVAGTEAEIFHRKTVAEIYRFAQGYPRLINIICDHALLTGFVKQQRTITPAVIQECAQELCLLGDTIRVAPSDFFERPPSRNPSPPVRPAPSDSTRMEGNTPLRPDTVLPTAQKTNALGPRSLPEEKTNRVPERRPRELSRKSTKPRHTSWAMMASLVVIVTGSVLLFQRDLLPEAGRSELAPPAPDDTSQAAPVQAGPETITMTPSDPVVQATSDGRLVAAKRGPVELAEEELARGNVDRAVRLLEDAIEESPTDLPRLRVLYAETLRRQAGSFSDKDAPQAERLLVKAVGADPKNAAAYFDLGMTYTKSKRYAEAISAFEEAAGLDDRSADTFFNLGFADAAAGDYASAEQMFRRAATLRPPYLDKVLFNLAVVQQKQGKTEKCIESLEEALLANPNNQRAQDYLRQLEVGSGGST